MIFLFCIFSLFIFNLLYKPKYTRFRPRGGFLFSAAMLFCISLKKKGSSFRLCGWKLFWLEWSRADGAAARVAPCWHRAKADRSRRHVTQSPARARPRLRHRSDWNLVDLKLMPRAANFACFNKLMIFQVWEHLLFLIVPCWESPSSSEFSNFLKQSLCMTVGRSHSGFVHFLWAPIYDLLRLIN
jgi:hypothetical protein